MKAKTTENDEENKSTVKFELVNEDDDVEFPNETGDETAIEAEEILPSKPFSEILQPDEPIDSRLSDFFSTLPQNNGTRFIVARLPDRSMSGKFRLPCDEEEDCESVYWKGETEPSELYAKIRNMNGGGVYRIRTHGNTGFVKGGTWTVTLGDPSKKSDKEKLIDEKNAKAKTDEQPRRDENSQVFVSKPQPEVTAKTAIKDFLEQAKEFKELQELFAPPPAAQTEQPAQTAAAQITKESIKMALIEKSLAQPELLEMALKSVFDIPINEAEEKPQGFWETIAQTFAANPTLQNKLGDVISGTVEGVSGLVGNLIMPNTPPAIPNLPISLNSIRAPRNDAEGAPQPKNEPQAQETAQTAPLQPAAAPEIVIVPSIKLED